MSRLSVGNDLTRRDSLVVNIQFGSHAGYACFSVSHTFAVQRVLIGAVSVQADSDAALAAKGSGINWTRGGNKTPCRSRTLNTTTLLAAVYNQNRRFPAMCPLPRKAVRDFNPTQLPTHWGPTGKAFLNWCDIKAHIKPHSYMWGHTSAIRQAVNAGEEMSRILILCYEVT